MYLYEKASQIQRQKAPDPRHPLPAASRRQSPAEKPFSKNYGWKDTSKSFDKKRFDKKSFNDGNWGLSFQTEGQAPIGNATADYLKQYNAYYVQNTQDKVIYLTFDAGFENGNTAAILDALKKHNAQATFFLVGNYLQTSPDLVKRMVAEGHNVGNHTFHHPDMSKLSTKDLFEKELTDLETLYEQTTGQPMKKYYRPPQGKYSESNLKMASDMGYKTFFWSLAYVDWYEDKQPTKEEAFKKLLGRIHPGAVVLLHSTSKTNGQILDELLTKWEEMGYHFGSLDDLVAGQ